MICPNTLPHSSGEHGTPKAITPLSNATALTPATLSTYESSSSSSVSSPEVFPSTHRRLRFPIPSPSRPRLDPRYAARLPHIDLLGGADDDRMAPRRWNERTSFFHPPPILSPRASELDVSLYDCVSPAAYITPAKRTRPHHHSATETQDRYIPSRGASQFHRLNLWPGLAESSAAARPSQYPSDLDASSSSSSAQLDASTRTTATETATPPDMSTDHATASAASAQQNLLTALLRTELLGENVDPFLGSGSSAAAATPNLRFSSATGHHLQPSLADPTSVVNSFGLTPMNHISERLISTPNKRKRRISKVPFKVLDAPALQDDFYLNLVDWSAHNVLAVGLGACVYLWSACTSKVTKLCDLSVSEDTVTGVSWAQRGTHLAVGTNKGEVQLWDTTKCKKVRSMTGHTARVGTLAWTGPILASGSRDRLIYLRDVRVQSPFTDKLSNHRQEVCGLKWSFEEPSFLASGGNDNNLHVFDSRNPCEPLHKFSEHTAAVKAIAWSPHQHGLLASGGGTADRCIRFYNTMSGTSLNKIDTGSQVCNLAWSQNCNEIVSTHGYSLNQIVVWRYPSMSKVATLTGHTFRVLYLAMSPDGSTVVTGAGDETLRFWQIFPGPRSDGKDGAGGLLFPNTIGSVIR